MPTARSAARRCAVAAVLVAALSGCSLLDPSAQPAGTPSGTPSTASSAGGGSVSTEQETCARVVEAARTAPQRLQEDPLGLLEELTALADTAPADLSLQITEVRDAVAGFRQGERRLTEVVGAVRQLQQRCSS